MCDCCNTKMKKETVAVEPLYSPMEGTIVKADMLTEHEKFFEIKLEGGAELGHMPGQFVQLSLFGIGEAPITVTSSPSKEDKNTFEICVRKVGSFTNALHQLGEGGKVGVRGPFGKPFPIDEFKGNDLLLVAGGIGIVPLRSLVKFVIDKRRDFGKVDILLGCKEPKDRLFVDEIDQWSGLTDTHYACTVDKGDPEWKGNVGVITTLIPGVDINVDRAYAVIVGPPIMYKFVLIKLIEKGMAQDRIIFSLERRMKCGVGKCGHCQINDKYVCQDGPTFTYDEIRGLEEAL